MSKEEYSLLFKTDLEIINEINGNEGDSDTAESILAVEVFSKMDENDQLDSLRIRFFSNEQISFVFEHTFTKENYEEFKKDQQLEVEFDEFPNVLEEVLSNVSLTDDSSETYHAILKSEGDDKVSLSILQELELCTTDIFKLDLEKCKSDRIVEISQKRYDELTKEYQKVCIQYKDMIKRIKRQDPDILKNFKPVNELTIS
jgi:hypothetical protein